MSLPDAWVDRIFEKLTLVYGHRFLRQWEGLDMAAVKADWARELGGYAQSPYAISHGLQYLPPDEPPTVLQFRELCRRAPDRAPRLPPPKPTDAQRQQALSICRDLRISIGSANADPRAWAYALQERERRGEHLSAAQQRAWREALETVPEEALFGFTRPPENSLPPGMRSQHEA